MNKLLTANFARLRKNKIFWLGTAGMFLWAVLMLAGQYQTKLSDPGFDSVLEDFFFEYAPIIGGVCAVFTSLFLGTDYSDGTIRNKIVIGHSRSSVYFSNLIVTSAACLIMNGAWILAMSTVGIVLFGWFHCNIITVLIYLLITVLMILSFTAVFTMIGMLNQNKAGVAVISLLTFLALLFLGSYCVNRLNEPEMYSGGPMITVVDGSVSTDTAEPEENPDYVRGTMRKMYAFIQDFLPTGQGIQISSLEAEHPFRMMINSLLIIVVITGAGAACFSRKDLK